MNSDLIVLQQIENRIYLYANCFKRGYTKLYYFSNVNDIHILEMDKPEIKIENLDKKTYYLYCKNDKGETTGYITVNISTADYREQLNVILASKGMNDSRYREAISKLKSDNYITELYDLLLKEKDKEIYEEILLAAIDFYNIKQEALNLTEAPLFVINTGIIKSVDEVPFTFYPYQYTEKGWNFLHEQLRFGVHEFDFYGKPRNLYLILVLSEFNVLRKYYVYEPSETLSTAKSERCIEAKQKIKEKIIEATSRYDLSELIEDKYGQTVVSALQELKPERVIFMKPYVEYENKNFTVSIKDNSLISATGKDIYIGALEIDQAFMDIPVPHKIKITEAITRFNPNDCLLNYGEDYIFFICDEDNIILSDCVLISYESESNIELYSSVSRKIDIEKMRRELFNVFQEYDKNEWDLMSSYIDSYQLAPEDTTFLEYAADKIKGLNIYQHSPVYLIELILLMLLKHYMPVNQNFIKYQVYAKNYRKHVFPESGSPYAVCILRINNGKVSYDYLPCGKYVQEIRMDLDDILILYAVNGDMWECSSVAVYNNFNKEESPYFYFPDLEIEVV